MKQQLLVNILLCLSVQIRSQCTVKPSQNLEPLVLYAAGEQSSDVHAHILSPHPGFESYVALAGLYARYAYQLDARALTSSSGSGCSCLKSVSTVVKKILIDNKISVSHGTVDHLPFWTSNGYEAVPYNDFYCATNYGDCKADTPLYLYKNSVTEDYYVSTAGKGPELAASPYPYSYPPLRPDLYLTPICYVWLDPTLTTTTTTTTTTTPASTTTTSFSSTTSASSTTSTGPTSTSTSVSTVSGTTVTGVSITSTSSTSGSSTTSSTSTTKAGVTSTSTAASTTTRLTTTNIYGSGEPPEETTEKTTKKRQWWKWLVGIAAGLIFVGLFIFVLSCCTVLFISPASHKDSVEKYSPDSNSPANVLPPQPVQAFSAGQPLSAHVVPPLPPGYVPT